jgi:hypothetical protein
VCAVQVKALTAWNLEAFVDAVKERAPSLAWAEVFAQLDTPELELPSAAGLSLIAAVHRLALSAPLPVTTLLSPWNNIKAQLQATQLLLTSCRSSSDVPTAPIQPRLLRYPQLPL